VFLGVVHRQPMEALLGLLLSDHLAALDSNDSSKEAATGPGRGLFVLPSGRRQQAAVGAVSSSFSMAADAAVAAAVGSGSGAPDVYGLLWSAEAAATYAAVQAAVAAGGRGVVPGAVWGARLALLPFMDTSAYKVRRWVDGWVYCGWVGGGELHRKVFKATGEVEGGKGSTAGPHSWPNSCQPTHRHQRAATQMLSSSIPASLLFLLALFLPPPPGAGLLLPGARLHAVPHPGPAPPPGD
jgi:hypothetical protein